MCGIVAIQAYGPDAPPVVREECLRIRDAMAVRGPDGYGYWESDRGDVALGHRRLAILDPSDRGSQPMRDRSGRFTIVFNGEIYNFRALRAEMESRGHAFGTGTDTEVLLALYAEHGPAMVRKLRGMYAFALWDEAERSLVLARDPHGIKPLYVADDGRTVRAASQVKALLAGGGVPPGVDPAGVAGFYVWGHVPEPFTLHSSIRAFPPGEVAIYREGREPRRHRVAPLLDLLVSSQKKNGTEREAWPAAIRDALLDSVRHHLESDVPVGLFLSAGLDSRVIARLCRDAGADVLAVTLGFKEHEGTPADEVPLATELATSLGIRHEVVRVTRADFDEHLDEILGAMDQPSIDGVNTWFVSRAAASLGLKVALSGLGGDELFGGYPSFREVPRAARALQPFNACPPVGRHARRLVAPFARRASSPKWASVLEYGGTLGGAYLLRRGLFLPWELPEFLDPELVRQGWDSLQSLPALEATVSGLLSDRLRVTALESTWYMRNQLLRDSDWAGMAHSLEIRVPLVDVELAQQLAPAMRGAAPPNKLDMVRAVERYAPETVLSRPKTGFVPPVAQWARVGENAPAGRGLRDWARMVLGSFVPDPGASERRTPGRRHDRPEPLVPGPRVGRKVLISTLPPSWGGGVPRMARFASECVREAGDVPILAWYRPYSEDPYLSPQVSRLGIGAVGERRTVAFDGAEGHELGTRFPELEVNQYRLSVQWLRLLDRADICLAASGNCLAARPFLDAGRSFSAWIATPWRDDRRSREKQYPPLRRLADGLVVRPLAERLERRILDAGRLLPLSEHTRLRFEQIRQRPLRCDVLPVPVDSERFRPEPSAVVPGRIGFIGRLEDPRKRIDRVVDVLRYCRDAGVTASALLVGGHLPSTVGAQLVEYGLDSAVQVVAAVEEAELPQLLKTLDVFLLPSDQEGLCVAALEAMACAVPVVSTRCGGPEEYVSDGETGFLCNPDGQLGSAVGGVLADRALRTRLGEAARALVERRYTPRIATAILLRALASET